MYLKIISNDFGKITTYYFYVKKIDKGTLGYMTYQGDGIIWNEKENCIHVRENVALSWYGDMKIVYEFSEIGWNAILEFIEESNNVYTANNWDIWLDDLIEVEEELYGVY